MATLDKNSKYPDKTGFHFNVTPADYAGSQRGDHSQYRENFYGGSFIDIDNAEGYKNWGNWIDKFEPDNRFAAISDKNAHLHAFPEIEAPWKFTEYTFTGVDESTQIIEPPLFSPKSLNQINTSSEGKIDSRELIQYETLYKYQNNTTGNIFTQEQLEKNGWIDNAAPSGKRDFTRIEAYAKRENFKHQSKNAGVRLYKKMVEVESTKWGQHGNIPEKTVNMMSPKEYFEPSNIYSNVVIPKYKASIGTPVIAENEGVIQYDDGADWRGLYKITIDPINHSSWISVGPSGQLQEWIFSGSNSPIKQPRPTTSKDNVLKLKFLGGKYNNGDIVHKGCAFWKGNSETTAKCTLAPQLSENDTPANPDPSLCMIYSTSSDHCPYYQASGPQDIAYYEAEAMNANEWAAMYAGIDNYDWVGGANNLTNGGAVFSATNSPLGGGALMYGGFALGAASVFNSPMSAPREMGETDLRWSVEYEFKKIPAEGRELYNDKGIMLNRENFKQFKLGTGKFAIDSYDTNTYKGVDTTFFGDRNVMSAWRWNNSVLPCYNPEKCNKAYGHQMVKNKTEGVFCGIGGEDWCRYYTPNCPYTNIPRRAREYDLNYKSLLKNILTPFRIFGLEYFEDLTEYYIDPDGILIQSDETVSPNGVFCAVGSMSSSVNINPITTLTDLKIYFYYDHSFFGDEAEHKSSRLFAHITQYNHENNQAFMILPDNGEDSKPSSYPDNIPWLVELQDDYKSPVDYIFYVENEKRFFGGRNPEYKDRSIMDGSEIFGMAAAGGGMFDTTNGGKGGDPARSYEDKGYGRGYWIDKYGEYITDGRSLGTIAANGYTPESYYTGGVDPDGDFPFEIVDVGARIMKVPPVSNGATPIKGNTRNSFITPEKTTNARVNQAYVYSSDTRSVLECDALQNLEDEEGRSQRPASIPAGQLPTERSFYRCAICSYDYLGKDMSGENDMPSSMSDSNAIPSDSTPSSFPSVNQIFTDYEAESYSYKCPVCGSDLIRQGSWTHFPNTQARGIVSIWGLPGQSVRNDGYYWKNPTIITRAFVSQILGKLGPMNPEKTGYELSPSNSASAASEADISRYFSPSDVDVWSAGVPSGASAESDFNNKSHNPSLPSDALKERGMTKGISNERLDGGTYDDSKITPSDTSDAGLDMITINTIKALRNRIGPMYGYTIGKKYYQDYKTAQQAGHQDRYGKQKERDFPLKAGTLDPEIIAATSNGGDNHVQYWDGQFPGTCVKEYYPTGPVWWRIHEHIGGISRNGGHNAIHMDESDNGPGWGGSSAEWFYTGDKLVSKAFFFLHGWIPLDKEVVKAYAIIQPSTEPSWAPIGRVFSGRKIDTHYHPFRTQHEQSTSGDHFNLASDIKEDSEVKLKWIDGYEGAAQNLSNAQDLYEPYNFEYDCSSDFSEIMQHSNTYFDNHFGYEAPVKTWAGILSYDGSGTDLTQNYTEEQLWKSKTFEEYTEDIEKDLMSCRLVCGDPEIDGASVGFKLFSRKMLDNYLNNETQPIPNYFDFSGMNDKLMYPKTGPVIDIKQTDSSWANDGQIIIQSNNVKLNSSEDNSVGNSSWGSGGMGAGSGGWVPRVLDITGVVKKRYNERIERSFTAQCGVQYGGLHSSVYNARNKSEFFDGHYDPDSSVNYRHWTSYGYWLNDPWHYPHLVNDEFPVNPYGDEYVLNPSDRINEVSAWYIPPEASESVDHPDYKLYHPENLITANNVAASGGAPYPDNYWYVHSELSDDQFFSCDLRTFPIERLRRPWRHKKGHWDTSNAVCPNQSCAIGRRGQTVSEFIQWAQATGRSTNIPTTSTTQCIYCGTSLITPPATGAVYADGDGIETIFYETIPEKDVLVNAVSASPVGIFSQLESFKSSFAVDVKSDSEHKWRTLFQVDYLTDTDEWKYREYNSNKTLVFKTSSDLPNFFKGVWADGEDLSSASASDVDGCHFIIPRARYIRYRAIPRVKKIYFPNSEGFDYADITLDGNYLLIPSEHQNMRDGEWEHGTLDIVNLNDEIVDSYTIVSNDESGIYVSGIDQSDLTNNTIKISKNFFFSTCGKFEVYGYDITSDTITLTSDADCFSTPYSLGNTSVVIPDFPTKIINVMSGVKNTASIPMYEVEKTTDNSFLWYTQKKYDDYSGFYYEEVISGSYVFDPQSIEIKTPTKWKNTSTGDVGYIWSLNTNLDIKLFKKITIPQFIQIRYFTGNGKSITIPVIANGSGPSYQLEKEAVCNISSTGLPDMGYSSKLNNKMNSKEKLNWQVYNHKPLYGEFKNGFLSGTELPPGGWRDSEIANLFGGLTQTDPLPNSKISGTVEGEVTFYGSPNSILSGDIIVYAKPLTTRSFVANGEKVVTYERTGGLKYTGFSVGVELDPVVDNRQGICFGLPLIVVYLRERELTEVPAMT